MSRVLRMRERRAAAREEMLRQRAIAQKRFERERQELRREQAREAFGFSEVPDRDLTDEELWRLPDSTLRQGHQQT